MTRFRAVNASLLFVGIAVICLFFADLRVTTLDPWTELGRMALGFVTPNFLDLGDLLWALAYTVAFAVAGVAGASVLGFGLAVVFHRRIVRWGCAIVRSVHELFWALLFLQFFGLSPLTGLLAILLPYAGIFAKVYAEILEEADQAPLRGLPGGTGVISGFFYARVPDVWPHLVSYTSYRLECGLRSSAVLGFVGLPTLGYHLETFFRQGQYSDAGALLILFYLLIATLRWWLRPRLVLPYIVAALVLIWTTGGSIVWSNVERFFTVDALPAPLHEAGPLLPGLLQWGGELTREQALPGIAATVVLTQLALVLTGVLTLLFFPLISRRFFGPVGRTLGHVFLVVMRSTPEYVLAYILLVLLGPSMLPAILALALHNGAIIGHLTGRHADQLVLRPDAPRGLNLYGYEVLPRVYGQFLAFLFYRWEVIMRETAILGILGIQTLGFYVDSAFSEIRVDRALFLIGITALLNLGIDGISRRVRAGLKLSKNPDAV